MAIALLNTKNNTEKRSTLNQFIYSLVVLGLLTRSTGKPERVFETLEYFRAGTRSIYNFRVRASRV